MYIAEWLDDLPELRVPAKVANINRDFLGVYMEYMTWGEPDHRAAVKAMQIMHKNINFYRQKAKEVRLKGMAKLAPHVLGAAMKARLQLVHSCICLLLHTSIAYKKLFPGFDLSCEMTPTSLWSHLNLSMCTNEVVGFRDMA